MSRRSPVPRRIAFVLAAVAIVIATGCVFWRIEPRAVPRPAVGDTTLTTISSPLKAHLADGSTVVFRSGGVVGRGELTGTGDEYPLLRGTPNRRTVVPLDSIVGLETFEGKVLMAPSIVASLAATAAGAAAAGLLAVAIFGSCPTIYADTGTGPVLEAEGFSYALAPLFEHRDVDPLRARPGADGTLLLELRNEALETHYINHIELLAVRHLAGTRVMPDQTGRAVAVHALRPLASATDRAGRDVRASLAAHDGQFFATDSRIADAARAGDLNDWIDITADDLAPGDSIAVVLRLRNSLLNTVLLYEGMLGGRDGADWLASGLQHIGNALELSRWYVATMGMHAVVDGAPLPVASNLSAAHARLVDVGPIAFRDVAIVLPRPALNARNVRVRLRFVADNWRIDHAMIAGAIDRPATAMIPVDRVVVPTPAAGGGPVLDTASVGALAEADDRYFETRPGQRMTLVFDTGTPRVATDSTTTYMLAWQGWYSEWIRGEWLARPTRTTPFVPGDSAVLTALRSWRAQQATLEPAFYASRIPVR